jgi:hypothetical protein
VVRVAGRSRGEGAPRPHRIWEATRNFQSFIRLKVIHHRNREMQFIAEGRASSRRGHHFRGRGGGRVSFAACRARSRAVTGKQGSAGGTAGQSSRSAGGQHGHRRPMLPSNESLQTCAGLERRPDAAFIKQQVGMRRRHFKCENTKLTCINCNKLRCISCNLPLRARAATTQSTSASGATWPSATHVLSAAPTVWR